MKTPSASIVISSLALVVALTGTAGAAGGWINGNRIKPHSITAKQIKTHAITKATLADGLTGDPTIGPAGPQGPPGAAGPPGAPGVIDPAKLVVVAGGDVNLAPGPGGNATATATCPSGTFLIGGGYSDMGTAQKVYAISSGPRGPAADGLQAWQVRARNDSPEVQETLWHAIAYCVVSP